MTARQYTNHEFGRGIKFGKISSKTAAYTITVDDGVVLVDATSGALTMTLPPVATAYDAATKAGQVVCVKKTDSGGNAVTVDADGSETIDGAANVALAAQYDTALLVAGPSEWHLLAPSV